MYYLINPLIWPFTIIPNLPQNLIEIIDSPIPLLVGMLGDKELAEEIDYIRNGSDNIIIIEDNKLTYYKEEKILFGKEPLDNLLLSLKKNYSEMFIYLNKDKNKENNEDYKFTCEKIYKNIYGSIQNDILKKIERICEKHYYKLKKSNYGLSVDTIKTEELELRLKIKEEFAQNYYDMNDDIDFYTIFSQTQIFASYLDTYIEIINKKIK
jgi:hypothetical protein